MTPYEINVLLHYYCRVGDHADYRREPPIWGETIASFQAANLLTLSAVPEVVDSVYRITPRGRAYVEALQRVPLPEQHWIVDWSEVSRHG